MDPFKLLELRAQYQVLSEIESMFPLYSKNKVAIHVNKKMREILKEMELVPKIKEE
jgi:hypothetical protein